MKNSYVEELQSSLRNHERRLKESLNDLSYFDQRQFDIAYNAINLAELQHVTENTTSRTVQDYAIIKAHYFSEKAKK